MLTLLLTASALAKPPCDADALAKGRAALPEVEASYHAMIGAAAIYEACDLPPKLERALQDWAGGMPDTQRMVDIRAAEDVVLWNAACKGGVEVLIGSMRDLPPDQHRPALWKGCDLGRTGWITEAEFLKADGALVSGIMTLHWLQTDGIDAAVARPLARALIGLP